MNGGGGGIRTPGSLRLNGFQDRRYRPLSHPSENDLCTTGIEPYAQNSLFVKTSVFYTIVAQEFKKITPDYSC